MSVINDIEKITDWVKENICNEIKLKVPNDDAVDNRYTHEFINPNAFAMYLPTKDLLPPKIPSPIPSICVQILEGKTNLDEHKGLYKVMFNLSAWNPGRHGMDMLIPQSDDSGKYKQWASSLAKEEYTRSADGWKDVWNFLDIVLRKLNENADIAGLRIARELDLTYGQFKDENVISDFYPYWFAWVIFYVEYPVVGNLKGLTDFL